MTVRRVRLDFHVVVELDVSDDVKDGVIAHAAYREFTTGRELTLAEMGLEYDGYTIDP